MKLEKYPEQDQTIDMKMRTRRPFNEEVIFERGKTWQHCDKWRLYTDQNLTSKIRAHEDS